MATYFKFLISTLVIGIMILSWQESREGWRALYALQPTIRTLRLLGLFGAFWGKVWALGAKVYDPSRRVQEP